MAVRDIEIQERENDLVLATFGRGFYVLDDYSPLREVSEEKLAEPLLFPIKDALIFNGRAPLGLRGKSFRGDDFYTAPNPPNGAVFTYYLPETLETRKDRRQTKEQELIKDDDDDSDDKTTKSTVVKVPIPTWEELEAEDREEDPAVILTVRDAAGQVIRRLTGSTGAGTHRVVWDLRFPSPDPTSLEPWSGNVFMDLPIGPRVLADTYTVTLSQRVEGVEETLGESQTVTLKHLENLTLPAADNAELLAFQRRAARLQGAALGAMSVIDDAEHRLQLIKKAIEDTSSIDTVKLDTVDLGRRARELEGRLWELQQRFYGDSVRGRRSMETLPGILERVGTAAANWATRAAITGTHEDAYTVAATQFEALLEDLRVLVQEDLQALDNDLEEAGAPWTPGRFPRWSKE